MVDGIQRSCIFFCQCRRQLESGAGSCPVRWPLQYGDQGCVVTFNIHPSFTSSHAYLVSWTVGFLCRTVHLEQLFSLSVMSDSFATPWNVVHQAPLPVGSFRQDYPSGLPFPSLRDLPIPGIKPASPALPGRFLITEPSGKPYIERVSSYQT